jgi:hypothetical protein
MPEGIISSAADVNHNLREYWAALCPSSRVAAPRIDSLKSRTKPLKKIWEAKQAKEAK